MKCRFRSKLAASKFGKKGRKVEKERWPGKVRKKCSMSKKKSQGKKRGPSSKRGPLQLKVHCKSKGDTNCVCVHVCVCVSIILVHISSHIQARMCLCVCVCIWYLARTMHKLPAVAAASARAFTCATPDFQALPPMLQEKQPSLYLYIISCTSSRDDPDYTFSIHLLEPAFVISCVQHALKALQSGWTSSELSFTAIQSNLPS